MKLQLKRCNRCGARGLGPGAVKLYPFDGGLRCAAHFKDDLDWEANRAEVVRGLQHLRTVDVERSLRRRARPLPKAPSWKHFIQQMADGATLALTVGDRKWFVRDFAMAVYAWHLRELIK